MTAYTAPLLSLRALRMLAGLACVLVLACLTPACTGGPGLEPPSRGTDGEFTPGTGTAGFGGSSAGAGQAGGGPSFDAGAVSDDDAGSEVRDADTDADIDATIDAR